MVEWSGVLFYKVIAGDIEHLSDLKLEVVEIYLQDIGSAAHTQFTMSDDILDLYDKKPELEECKTAMIHL